MKHDTAVTGLDHNNFGRDFHIIYNSMPLIILFLVRNVTMNGQFTEQK